MTNRKIVWIAVAIALLAIVLGGMELNDRSQVEVTSMDTQE